MLWQRVDPATYSSSLSAPLPPEHIVFAGPGYSQPRPPKNGLATAALVVGLIGLVMPILAIAAVILGHIAARNKDRVGLNRARGGYGLGWVALGGWGLLALVFAILEFV